MECVLLDILAHTSMHCCMLGKAEVPNNGCVKSPWPMSSSGVEGKMGRKGKEGNSTRLHFPLPDPNRRWIMCLCVCVCVFVLSYTLVMFEVGYAHSARHAI